MKTRNGFVTNSSSSSFIVKAPLTSNVKFDNGILVANSVWYMEFTTLEQLIEFSSKY